MCIRDSSLNDAIVAPVDDAGKREGALRQELDSVDFYITQGYVDIANDTLDLMERQFGNNPEITARRQKLELKLAGDGQPAANPFDFAGSEHSVNAESPTPNGEFAFAGTSDNGSGNHV